MLELTPAERPTAIRVLEDLKPLVESKASPLYDSESEMKKLKAQMEQMKLAHERQLVEEKQKAIQLQLAQEQQLRCPDVVNALLKQAGGVAPMTWQECEIHNLKYYKEVFIVPKFDPKTFGEWYHLLQKMDQNLFVRTFHLKRLIGFIKVISKEILAK